MEPPEFANALHPFETHPEEEQALRRYAPATARRVERIEIVSRVALPHMHAYVGCMR